MHFSSYTQTVPPNFDFDHRTVTVHRALTLTDPGTGQVSPFPGATVSVYNNSGGSSRKATTAADGTFTTSLDADGDHTQTSATFFGWRSSTYGNHRAVPAPRPAVPRGWPHEGGQVCGSSAGGISR